MKLAVPKGRPKNVHPVVTTIVKAIRKCSANDGEFLIWGVKGEGSIANGPGSTERVTLLLDSFAKALVTRGHDISVDADIEIHVENELFKLKIYETKNRKPHQTTPSEIKGSS